MFENGEQLFCGQLIRGMQITDNGVIDVPAKGTGGGNGAAVRRWACKANNCNFLMEVVRSMRRMGVELCTQKESFDLLAVAISSSA